MLQCYIFTERHLLLCCSRDDTLRLIDLRQNSITATFRYVHTTNYRLRVFLTSFVLMSPLPCWSTVLLVSMLVWTGQELVSGNAGWLCMTLHCWCRVVFSLSLSLSNEWTHAHTYAHTHTHTQSWWPICSCWFFWWHSVCLGDIHQKGQEQERTQVSHTCIVTMSIV